MVNKNDLFQQHLTDANQVPDEFSRCIARCPYDTLSTSTTPEASNVIQKFTPGTGCVRNLLQTTAEKVHQKRQHHIKSAIIGWCQHNAKSLNERAVHDSTCARHRNTYFKHSCNLHVDSTSSHCPAATVRPAGTSSPYRANRSSFRSNR